jgi:dephospho-CoA kinase
VPAVLAVGLTGGIGAGKSAVSRQLVRHGAALIDADALAREVVEPGTEGLAELVEAFGAGILRPDGALDREALGRLVFGDTQARTRLNGIVHPRIGQRTGQLMKEAAESGAPVLVHDVPLLVEGGMTALYHLVLVVTAPREERMRRLTELRGMRPEDAEARMAAQATDAQRAAVADVLLANDGPLRELEQRVGALWTERLVPYAENVAAARPAPRAPVVLVDPDPGWAAAGARLVARLRHVAGARAVTVEHIGSTSVPDLIAKPVLDLQVEVAAWADVEALETPLTEAGFARIRDIVTDPPRAGVDPDPEQWRKHVHRSCDPGQAANVHVRVAGTAGARGAIAVRDRLRADPQLREHYAAVKRELAAQHPDDVEAYAEGKTPFLEPLLARALSTG